MAFYYSYFLCFREVMLQQTAVHLITELVHQHDTDPSSEQALYQQGIFLLQPHRWPQTMTMPVEDSLAYICSARHREHSLSIQPFSYYSAAAVRVASAKQRVRAYLLFGSCLRDIACAIHVPRCSILTLSFDWCVVMRGRLCGNSRHNTSACVRTHLLVLVLRVGVVVCGVFYVFVYLVARYLCTWCVVLVRYAWHVCCIIIW